MGPIRHDTTGTHPIMEYVWTLEAKVKDFQANMDEKVREQVIYEVGKKFLFGFLMGSVVTGLLVGSTLYLYMRG